jgi:hypothetical protein
LEDALGKLRDEHNRLKGEQRRPGGPTKKRPKLDRSSEREQREQPTAWRKRAKLTENVIDRQVEYRLDPAELPADAELKDHVEVTVQDLVLRTDNIWFRCPPGMQANSVPGLKRCP